VDGVRVLSEELGTGVLGTEPDAFDIDLVGLLED
jgi:hypothetical protein